jgi:hypothetical protein
VDKPSVTSHLRVFVPYTYGVLLISVCRQNCLHRESRLDGIVNQGTEACGHHNTKFVLTYKDLNDGTQYLLGDVSKIFHDTLIANPHGARAHPPPSRLLSYDLSRISPLWHDMRDETFATLAK